jgi:RNA polymerase sigma-70 factor (ECF subfamily)
MEKTQSTLNISSDNEVIVKILNGEVVLFEILIRRYNPVLYKIARSYGFSHQDAQDLLQDTHITAYQQLSQFEGKATYKTWISKIIMHKCLYKLKYGYYKNEVPAVQPSTSDTQPLHMNASVQPDQHTVNKELGIILEKSLETLPPIYRTVFVLREIEGFSVKETAELLNISNINVKVRLNRAKSLLQKEVERFYSGADIYSFNLIYCDAVVQSVFAQIEHLHG